MSRRQAATSACIAAIRSRTGIAKLRCARALAPGLQVDWAQQTGASPSGQLNCDAIASRSCALLQSRAPMPVDRILLESNRSRRDKVNVDGYKIAIGRVLEPHPGAPAG